MIVRIFTLALLLLPLAASAEDKTARELSLSAEMKAARGRKLYLVLDPRGPHVDLKASGLLLRRFPVESARFGSPRLDGLDPSWPAASFRLVSELPEPERPKIPIQAQEEKPSPATARPVQTAEADLEGLPTHYRLRFAPGLDLSVLGEAGVADLPGRLWRLRHRLLEGWGGLANRVLGEPVPPRVVLFMTPEEARRLFVALQPEAELIVRF